MIKVLDLYCGAGGAGMGYYNGGAEVTGVDKAEQKEYPFKFIEADAIKYLEENFHEYDLIHASPPCQHFTKYNNCRKNLKEKYEDLIDVTRNALIKTGKPYAIENVEGSPLIEPVKLCGSMFALDVQRHRLFESNFIITQPTCDHSIWKPNRYPGGRSRERGHARVLCRKTVEVGSWNIPIKTQKEAMGITHINNLRMLSESVPPSYTEFILNEFLRQEAETLR